MGFVFSAAIADPSIRVPHVLWLERVDIEQPVLPEQELIETAFTYNFARVLRQKKIFKAIKIETGAAAQDDWIVRVRIERIMQRGKIPLISYLATPLTLGLYEAAGKVEDLEFEMAGRFEVRDGSGKLLGSGEATHRGELAVYAKNRTNAFCFFMDERSRFVDELVDRLLTATGARDS
jgi:hypothetical protein